MSSNVELRKLLIMINSYKETITNLEIRCANYQVAIEDLRAELEEARTPHLEPVGEEPEPEPTKKK